MRRVVSGVSCLGFQNWAISTWGRGGGIEIPFGPKGIGVVMVWGVHATEFDLERVCFNKDRNVFPSLVRCRNGWKIFWILFWVVVL